MAQEKALSRHFIKGVVISAYNGDQELPQQEDSCVRCHPFFDAHGGREENLYGRVPCELEKEDHRRTAFGKKCRTAFAQFIAFLNESVRRPYLPI